MIDPKLLSMRKEAINFGQDFDYFRQEAQKAHQLRRLLHGQDHRFHGAGLDHEVFEKFGSRRSTTCGTGGKNSNIFTSASNTRLETDDVNQLDLQRDQPQPLATLENDWQLKFVRLILRFCSLILNVDLFGGQMGEQRCIQIKFFNGLVKLRLASYAIINKSDWFRTSRCFRVLPRLILLLYTASAAYLVYYLYHQYIYDYHRFRLMRVRWLNATHPEEARARKLTLEREDQLLESIRVSEETIHRIGGPQMHARFAVEAVYLMFLLSSLVAYLSTQLLFNFVAPFDFYIIRNFMDFSVEQWSQRESVGEQVRRFIESSRNHTRALAWFSRKSLGARLYFERYSGKQRQEGQLRARSVRFSVGDVVKQQDALLSGIERNPEADHARAAAEALGELDELELPQSLSCKQLSTMLDSNDLRPLNQTPGWVACQLHRFCHLWLFCLTIACLFDASVVYLNFLYLDPARRMTWTDVLMSTALALLLFVCNVSTLFYTTTNVFTALDQAELALKLRELIELVINLNNLRFYRNSQLKARVRDLKMARRGTLMSLHAPAGGLKRLQNSRLCFELFKNQCQLGMFDPDYENSMNKDMLLAIIHYKSFVAALMPLKRSLRGATFMIVIIMFIFPIISRLHMPYFKVDSSEDARILTVGLSLIVLMPVNINLIPICYLHKRCMDLYNELNSLLAHATEIISYHEGRSIYDRLIVSMLRKELSFPERMTLQFAIRVNGINLTYPGLVRLLFYFGFIVLSIISENQTSEQDVAGTLLHDPFGIF